MGKLIFALILFALGIGASRAPASLAAAPSGPCLAPVTRAGGAP